MRLTQLLSRADDELLEELVGGPVVRLLESLDPTLSSPRRLRELVEALHSPEELLRDRKVRQQLLDLLPIADATEVAGLLRLDTKRPYESLRAANFKRGSKAEKILFTYLGVDTPQPPEETSALPMVESFAAYGLFSHQRDACKQSQNRLRMNPHRVLLHMPTGSGKTRTAMHIIASELRQQEPTLVIWLAYSEELCEQAASEFEKAWHYLGDRELKTYRMWGSRDLDINDVRDGFMVAGLAKTFELMKRDPDFLARMADRVSLVIIDEAHQAIAQTYRLVLEVLCDRNEETKLLGLTATPGRTWNDPDADRELANFFNRQKVTLSVRGYDSPVDYLIDEKYLARPVFQPLFYDSNQRELSASEIQRLANTLDIPDDILERLAVDDQRNLAIISAIEGLVQKHSRVIVFAATVGHARMLAAVLRARGILANSITSGTASAERSRIIAEFRDRSDEPYVLCNYGVLTTGFDAPRTSAAVIARPTKSLVLYSQMVGRATRGTRAGGNEVATIVTVVDQNLPGFGAMEDAFMNWEDVW
ncbi:restriction endonuclease [Mycolicibacterium smegmatis]|nr:restriction endonuclease [Mycolicibacterium smegmatis MC2 155]AIU13109.1 restriction endonuclease [Mycolicibacterium smegmatis]AIU19733.1 restriction endonuclease [Mycolicibacterium smegmatis]STZ33349.1 Type III restriction enzyme [Mycolicibacterium smegmatis]